MRACELTWLTGSSSLKSRIFSCPESDTALGPRVFEKLVLEVVLQQVEVVVVVKGQAREKDHSVPWDSIAAW